MSDRSTIEWTDATWNPVTGCTKVSAGCKNCYAETFAERFRGVPGHPFEQGFDVRLWPQRLDLPLRWRKPKMIFVNSMSDLFHEAVPDQYIQKVFDTMIEASQHIFQVLTKRPVRMKEWVAVFLQKTGKKLPLHIWLGVSVENQEAVWRISHLQKTPAQIRFLSLEPLLGPLDLRGGVLKQIHWVIVGGESGHQARPIDPKWVFAIKEDCQHAEVPFFFKQWGAFDPESGRKVGKKSAGRVLEGRTWDGLPLVTHDALPIVLA